jgi:hypothetical protein
VIVAWTEGGYRPPSATEQRTRYYCLPEGPSGWIVPISGSVLPHKAGVVRVWGGRPKILRCFSKVRLFIGHNYGYSASHLPRPRFDRPCLSSLLGLPRFVPDSSLYSAYRPRSVRDPVGLRGLRLNCLTVSAVQPRGQAALDGTQ